MIHLIVTSPFANRNVGERIKDEAEIASVLGSHHKMHVVKIDVPDEPKVVVKDDDKPKK
jgi:hypothetical protein